MEHTKTRLNAEDLPELGLGKRDEKSIVHRFSAVDENNVINNLCQTYRTFGYIWTLTAHKHKQNTVCRHVGALVPLASLQFAFSFFSGKWLPLFQDFDF